MTRRRPPAVRGGGTGAACARAFTLIEAIMGALIVALIVVGAMHAVGASGADQARASRRARASLLAQSLLDEVCAKQYSAAGGGGGAGLVIIGGIVGGVSDALGGGSVDASSSRSGYDSVDAYNGLVDSPPHEPDGTVIPGFSGWSRRVAVQLVSAADGSTASASDAGVKKVTVTVMVGGAAVETRSALVVNAP